MKRQYLSHFSVEDGVILLTHTDKGRAKQMTDAWLRIKFFVWDFPNELAVYSRPLRIIKALREAAVKALTFDKNVMQPDAESSVATTSVGKFGDSGLSPFSSDTSTRCVSPQSGQLVDESSAVRERHSSSI